MNFVFVPNYSAPKAGVDGARKAIINSHVARHHHHQRRHKKPNEPSSRPPNEGKTPEKPVRTSPYEDELVLYDSIEAFLPFPDHGILTRSIQKQCVHHYIDEKLVVNVMARSWLPATGQQQDLCAWLLPFTLSHPIVQNTFIVSAGAHLLAQLPASKQVAQLRSSMLQLKIAGLSGIKQLVGDPLRATTVATISAISGLMAVELYEENGTATRAHTNGMRKVLRQRGGFVGIRTDVAEMMYMLLLISAAWSRSLPAAPPTISHPPIPAALRTITSQLPSHLHSLGKGLTSPESSVLGGDLRAAAYQLREFIQYREFQRIYPHSSLGKAEVAFTVSRFHFEYTLLAYPFYRQQQRRQSSGEEWADFEREETPPPTLDFSCEEACRVAMIIFINDYNQLLPRRSKFWTSLALQLIEVLDSVDLLTAWDGHYGTLHWTLYIGAYAASYGPERRIFVDYLTDLSQSLGQSSWEATQNCLRSHFYIDRLHRDAFHSIWQELRPMDEKFRKEGMVGKTSDHKPI